MMPNSEITVVHVSSAHPWTDNRVHLREAASLAAAGYRVRLIAVEQDASAPVTGVDVVQLPNRPRLRRLTIGTLHAVWCALQARPTVVHLHDPELVWSVLLFRALRIRVIFDAHEDVPQQILVKHYLPVWSRRLLSVASGAYIWLASRSDHVIAATEAVAERFPTDRVTVVRNYPRLRSEEEHLALVANRSGRVAYSGALTRERGATVMLEAMSTPQFPAGWGAVFAGVIAPADLLTEMRKHSAWSKVDYLGQVSPEVARDMLLDCRVGLVVLQDNVSYRQALPTKMFEYFAAGIPAVASDFPLWREIIEAHDCGLLVDPANPDSIADAIRFYADNPEILERHGANARLAAEAELNWRSQEDLLIGLYRHLMPTGSHD